MPDQPKPTHTPPARDRRRDAELLAADLFGRRFAFAAGKLNTDHLAREALEAARAFYRVADEPPAEPAGEPKADPAKEPTKTPAG